jgi:O-antigen/teichoic acid export membrane protein
VKRGLGTLAHGTVVYGLGEVLSRVPNFLLLPVFTAYLSPADYGVISMLTALTIFLTPVFSLGLGGGIAPSYFDVDSRSHKQNTINTSVGMLLVSTVILVVAGSITSTFLSRALFQTASVSLFVRISIVTTAFTIIAIPIRLFFQFEERAKLYVTFSMTSLITSTLFSVVAVVVMKRGVRGMLEATLAGQIVALALFTVPILGWLRPKIDHSLARELLRVSLPLVLAFGCVFLLQNGNKYLLQWLGGLGDVGVYSIGLSIGTLVNVIVVAFQSAWVPYFMSFADKRETAKIVFGRVLTLYVFGMGALGLALFAIARPLILIMTRPAFHGAWRVVGLAATAQVLAGVSSILLPGMYMEKEVQFIGVLQGVAGAAGVVTGVCLIPRFGIVGAALSLVFSYLVLVAAQLYWNRRRGYLDVHYESSRLLRFACFYCCYAVLALWNRNVSLFAEAGISGVLLLIIPGALYSQLNAEERHSLWRLPQRLLGSRGITVVAKA